jgi:UDP-2-acetamido-2-deoxy-ribo-hexuluronate aminotransferase
MSTMLKGTQMQFIDLKTQHRRLEAEIAMAMQRVFAHGQFIMGEEIDELERQLADFCASRHCIAVSSGTDAILAALMVLDIQPGDEVITSPFTFFATAETILLLGARPVFVDIDPHTMNMDAALIGAAINDKTKAILAVSLYGQCSDMRAINVIAEQYDLVVIEDAAQSFGATYDGAPSCSLTPLATTSFFPAKPLGCYGDGGAVFTQDDAMAVKLKMLRNHGQQVRYQHECVGLNARLDTLQAAILLVKLKIFPEELVLRKVVAKRYNELLDDVVARQQLPKGYTSTHGQYTIRVPNRAEVMATLQVQGIPTVVHYPTPLHRQPAVTRVLGEHLCFPHAERAAHEVLSLPMHPYLTEDQQVIIVDALKQALQNK